MTPLEALNPEPVERDPCQDAGLFRPSEAIDTGANRHVVVAVTSLADLYSARRIVCVLFPALSPVVAAPIGIGAAITVGGSLRPVQGLADLASEIASGRRPVRLGVSAYIAESQALSTQLDLLLEVIQAFDREHTYLEDAGHGLRTPVAIGRAEIELAQRDRRVPGAADALQSAIEEIDRLDETAPDLLVLGEARAVRTEDSAPVDVKEVAQHAADRVRRDPRQRDVRLSVVGSGQVMG